MKEITLANYKNLTIYDIPSEKLDHMTLLSKIYPNITSCATEIINLKAILNLPKATEHFLSDIHGQYDTFIHILNSGSGVIRDKIERIFPDYSTERKNELATLIYYPRMKTAYLEKHNLLTDKKYKEILSDLIDIAKIAGSKYTRSKVRKLMTPDISYIMEELLQSHNYTINKERYYNEIINSIIETEQQNSFIISLCRLIQVMSVNHLHILGDIYDRGNKASQVLDELMRHPSIDITWGNHDILYMGACSGNYACICNVVRNACKYNTLTTLEDDYGISLRPLIAFALKNYENDPCLNFYPNLDEANDCDEYTQKIISKIHKAIVIMQLKVEAKLINRHPNYKNDNLRKLEFINFDNHTVTLNGKEYKLVDESFPTVNKDNPTELTDEEHEILDQLALSFMHSEKLQRHVKFLFSNGSMYLKYNGNLLFHGCIPTNPDGTFMEYTTEHNHTHKGMDFLNYCDKKVRKGFFSESDYSDKSDSVDFFWFLWCCNLSPLYGKKDICTFEKYFLSKEDSKNITEERNDYYRLINDPAYCTKILKEFKLENDNAVIINGHMPVNIKKGETPVKANGKYIVIDGGICKSYYSITGISGYTLVYNSHGLTLTAHQPFIGTKKAISDNFDIIHSSEMITKTSERLLVKDTDQGKIIQSNIDDLTELLTFYRFGLIKQK